MSRQFLVQVRGLNGMDWRPLYPDRKLERERNELVRRLGDWTRDTDCDLIGGAIKPSWVSKAEERLEEIQTELRPIPLRGSTPVRLRCSDTDHPGLVVEIEIKNKLPGNDPSGYDPTGEVEVGVDVFLKGERISQTHAWVDPALIHRAKREWEGTADVREYAYDLASHLINAANQRCKPARFNGYAYGR